MVSGPRGRVRGQEKGVEGEFGFRWMNEGDEVCRGTTPCLVLATLELGMAVYCCNPIEAPQALSSRIRRCVDSGALSLCSSC